jgi:hypothetical protein
VSSFANAKAAETDLGKMAQLRGQAFVDILMADDAIQDIPDSAGMRVIYNLPLLSYPLKSDNQYDLVIRQVTEPFWSACIQLALEGGGRVCAVGTPGIGKSASTPYLIYLLLFMKRTVVFLLRSVEKDNWYYEFTPTPQMSSPYLCQIYPEATVRTSIPSLQNPKAFFIIDPGRTNDSSDPEAIKAKLILASSPNSKHWGGSSFSKIGLGFYGGTFMYYPMWSLDELLAARPILNKELTELAVRQRYFNVGGVPRHIFYGYEDALRAQDLAINKLTAAQTIEFVSSNVDGVLTIEEDEPKSALYGLTSSKKTQFREYFAVPVSTGVMAKILEKFLRNIWVQVISGQAPDFHFEKYTLHFFAVQERMLSVRECIGLTEKVVPVKTRGKKKINNLEKENNGGEEENDGAVESNVGKAIPVQKTEKKVVEAVYSQVSQMKLGGQSMEIKYTWDVIGQAIQQPNIMFCPFDTNNPLIDFAFSTSDGSNVHIHAFQATTGRQHSAYKKQCDDFEKEIGDSSASVYYVVPHWQFGKFKTTPVKPFNESQNVRVYHVNIPDPRSKEEQKQQKQQKQQKLGSAEN